MRCEIDGVSAAMRSAKAKRSPDNVDLAFLIFLYGIETGDVNAILTRLLRLR